MALVELQAVAPLTDPAGRPVQVAGRFLAEPALAAVLVSGGTAVRTAAPPARTVAPALADVALVALVDLTGPDNTRHSPGDAFTVDRDLAEVLVSGGTARLAGPPPAGWTVPLGLAQQDLGTRVDAFPGRPPAPARPAPSSGPVRLQARHSLYDSCGRYVPAGQAWHETDALFAQALLDGGRASRLAT